MEEPRAARLMLPKGYQSPSGRRPHLPWSHVEQELHSARNFWLATAQPDGRPHVTPVWGVWVYPRLYFDGIASARWARNLAANPEASVHLESGEHVVILEGRVKDEVTDAVVGARIVEEWDAKYGRLHPGPSTDGIFCLHPRTARAWTEFPEDATRWEFSAP